MSPGLEEKLKNKYPKAFRDIHGDPMDTCMAWGCEHGDGWFDLLDRTLEKAVDLDPELHLTQVKEKYGELTIYAMCNDKADDIMEQACVESETICEACGSTDNVQRSGKFGWVFTRCEECWNGIIQNRA